MKAILGFGTGRTLSGYVVLIQRCCCLPSNPCSTWAWWISPLTRAALLWWRRRRLAQDTRCVSRRAWLSLILLFWAYADIACAHYLWTLGHALFVSFVPLLYLPLQLWLSLRDFTASSASWTEEAVLDDDGALLLEIEAIRLGLGGHHMAPHGEAHIVEGMLQHKHT